MKKVSIIIPVYNSEKTIGKCLESLVKQTYQNIEIIVINDGSNDNTIKIIRDYHEKHPNKIKMIDRENKGISFTRNEGINKATGEYLAFVDSDDYVDYHMVEKMINKLEKEKADIVICDYIMFFEDYEKYIHVWKKIKDLKSEPRMINKIDYGPWNKLYRKEIFNNVRFPLNTKYEDLSTILKACYKANKIVKINEALYYYYSNSNGQTQTIDSKIYDIFIILEDIIKFFSKIEISLELRDEIEFLCINKAFIYSEISTNNKDVNFTLHFIKKSYNFINENFKNWQIRYIKRAENLKLTRIIRCFPLLYKIKLIYKTKRNRRR